MDPLIGTTAAIEDGELACEDAVSAATGAAEAGAGAPTTDADGPQIPAAAKFWSQVPLSNSLYTV